MSLIAAVVLEQAQGYDLRLEHRPPITGKLFGRQNADGRSRT